VTDHLDATASANLVAIDTAKDWNVVLVQETSGARRSSKVANRKLDHDRLITFLKNLPGRVLAAVEPTGDYHRLLAYRFLSEGIEVVSISSVALVRVARYRTWDKNDPKDAQVILSMLTQCMVLTYYV